MLEKLRKLNPDIEIYSVKDKEFKKYGRVLDIDASEFIAACEKIPMPKSGCSYVLTEETLENLSGSEKLRNILCGGLDAQIGLCWGYNSKLNGLEYHNGGEINLAAKPMVILLALRTDMDGNELSADNVKAFLVEKGVAVLMYANTMHYCPCQATEEGFYSVVVLQKDTNADLDKPTDDKLLINKNKWLICHDKNENLINQGVYPGIHGTNYEIKF